MLEQYKAEICELHDFFQAWFTGALANTDANFARFADVMADGFVIISPAGKLSERPALLTGLRAAHQRQPGIRIWTQNHQLRHQVGGLALLTYAEWQESAVGTTARLSTVLFQAQAGTPNGVVWLHVHETWLQQ
ncbi:MAG: DUF4440 domain-containing protein [Caldilinea sp. CFX5]|nr:DUF4440 domain-containing protein [Caldilinea sp. CFX5]